MEHTGRFQYEMMGDNVAVSEIVENIMKSLIGTMFIERDKFQKLENERSVGRTFFADRVKKLPPVNDSFITKFRYVCTDVLKGYSEYDAETASIALNKFFNEYLHLQTEFLCFFSGDGDELRSAKVNGWIELLTGLLMNIKDVVNMPRNKIVVPMNYTVENLLETIKKQSANSYTEAIIQRIETKTRCADISTSNCEKEYGKFSFDQIYKEYTNEIN